MGQGHGAAESSDVLVFALSMGSVRSPVCQAELRYARALGIPVLPVQVGILDERRITSIAPPQVVDYRRRDLDSALGLVSAVALIESQPRRRPNPPPPRPPAPFAYLSAFARRVEAVEITREDQLAIVDEVGRRLSEEGDAVARRDLLGLLHKLRERPEILLRIVQEIDEILAGADPESLAHRTAASPASPAPADRDVRFTAYPPQAVRPDHRHPLLVFAHVAGAFVGRDGVTIQATEEVDRQARGILGAAFARQGIATADSSAELPRGAELSVKPWLEGGEFDPPRARLRWEGPVHRVEFLLRVREPLRDRRLRGGVQVFLNEVLLIAHLTFTVQAGAAVVPGQPDPVPVSARQYRRIFASYSHRDREIVERVSAAVSALGDRYLIDVDELRSGEEWAPRLAELIDQADVFQLFWSQNSMRSPFVRREWEHALTLGRQGFIRPVYWENPRPEDRASGLPPEPLERIQFSRLPSEAVRAAPARQVLRPAMVVTVAVVIAVLVLAVVVLAVSRP